MIVCDMVNNTVRLPDTFNDLRSSIVKVLAHHDGGLKVGTGFLVHADGYVVTAHHVVEKCSRVEVIPDNWRYPIPARRALRNRDDMAILTINYKGLDENFKARFAPAAVLPRHREVLAGSDVGIAGYAWGMHHEKESTLFVFKRIIALNVMHPPHSQGLFYYIDGTAIVGMSGGPVFSIETGEVVGVVVKIEPEEFFQFTGEDDPVTIPSAEHLTVALQSMYIHAGLEAYDIVL